MHNIIQQSSTKYFHIYHQTSVITEIVLVHVIIELKSQSTQKGKMNVLKTNGWDRAVTVASVLLDIPCAFYISYHWARRTCFIFILCVSVCVNIIKYFLRNVYFLFSLEITVAFGTDKLSLKSLWVLFFTNYIILY